MQDLSMLLSTFIILYYMIMIMIRSRFTSTVSHVPFGWYVDSCSVCDFQRQDSQYCCGQPTSFQDWGSPFSIFSMLAHRHLHSIKSHMCLSDDTFHHKRIGALHYLVYLDWSSVECVYT